MSDQSSRRLIPLLILVLLAVGAWAFFDSFTNVGYMPKQPLAFSHKLHAGTRKIPCLYCHANAERSRHATVPTMNVCMNCHIPKPRSCRSSSGARTSKRARCAK